MSQMNPKKFLHNTTFYDSQFNYHTLPVTPFKECKRKCYSAQNELSKKNWNLLSNYKKNDYLNSQITWNYFIPGRITSYNKFKKRRKYREMNNKLKKEYKKEKSKQIQCKELQIENIKKKKYREYEI